MGAQLGRLAGKVIGPYIEQGVRQLSSAVIGAAKTVVCGAINFVKDLFA